MPHEAALETRSSYLRVGELAEGGMGRVDLALRREGTFRRLYAVKRMKRELRDDPSSRAMFLEEARIAGLIRHANVVSVLDVGEDAEGPFLVMDFVEGVSAAKLLSRVAARGDKLSISMALEMARQIANGLDAAHELRGADGTPLCVVHRDVSPHNVLVGFDGLVRVTDFGIAKALGRSTRTTTGILKGKMSYLAPELLRFEEPDRRADLFALGVVMFELLTASRLYPEGVEGARRILREPPPDVRERRPETPVAVADLIAELLSKSVSDRPESAKDVAARLEGPIATAMLEGGSAQVGTFVRERFGAERDELETRIQLALERFESGEAPLAVGAPIVDIEPTQRTRHRARTWVPIAAGVAIAVAGLAVGSFVAWSGAQSDARAARQPVPAPIAAPPAAAAPVPALDDRVAARAEEPATPAAAREAPPERSEPARSRRARRRALPARGRRAVGTKSSAPRSWDWQP